MLIKEEVFEWIFDNLIFISKCDIVKVFGIKGFVWIDLKCLL